jgi:hypothetical protein
MTQSAVVDNESSAAPGEGLRLGSVNLFRGVFMLTNPAARARWVGCALASALVAALCLVATPASANPGCVTRAEFDQVQRGMTKSRVHGIFDTAGVFLDGGAGGFARYYRTCQDGSVGIEYAARPGSPARVSSKGWHRQSVGVVTAAELRRVVRGMTRAQVHRIFDTRGIVVIPAGNGHPDESREYRMWSGCAGVDYRYRDGAMRVVGKYRGSCIRY